MKLRTTKLANAIAYAIEHQQAIERRNRIRANQPVPEIKVIEHRKVFKHQELPLVVYLPDHEDGLAGWYHYAEDLATTYGPFTTEEKAKEALKEYALTLMGPGEP